MAVKHDVFSFSPEQEGHARTALGKLFGQRVFPSSQLRDKPLPTDSIYYDFVEKTGRLEAAYAKIARSAQKRARQAERAIGIDMPDLPRPKYDPKIPNGRFVLEGAFPLALLLPYFDEQLIAETLKKAIESHASIERPEHELRTIEITVKQLAQSVHSEFQNAQSDPDFKNLTVMYLRSAKPLFVNEKGDGFCGEEVLNMGKFPNLLMYLLLRQAEDQKSDSTVELERTIFQSGLPQWSIPPGRYSSPRLRQLDRAVSALPMRACLIL